MRTCFTLMFFGLLLAAPSARAQSEEETQTTTPRTTTSSRETPLLPPTQVVVADEPRIEPVPTAIADPAHIAVRAIQEAAERIVQLEVALGPSANAAAQRELAAVRATLSDALVAVGALAHDRGLAEWIALQGAGNGPHLDSAPEVARTSGALTAEEFSRLARTIEVAPFNEGKLQALRAGLGTQQLSAAQAGRLLELFSFSRDRVDVLVFLHPRIPDRENFGQLLSALKFESDRKAVRDRLGLDG